MLVLYFFLSVASANSITRNTDYSDQVTRQISAPELEFVAESVFEASVKIITFDGHGTGTYYTWRDHTFVITAAHVVAGNPGVFVSKGENLTPGVVIYSDSINDIAIIDIKLDIKPIVFRPKKNVVGLGAKIFSAGFPAYFSKLFMRDEVAGYEQDGNGGLYVICHSFVWPGMSGASVFDEYGQVVGIVTAAGIGRTELGIQILDDIVWIRPVLLDNEQLKTIFAERR